MIIELFDKSRCQALPPDATEACLGGPASVQWLFRGCLTPPLTWQYSMEVPAICNGWMALEASGKTLAY